MMHEKIKSELKEAMLAKDTNKLNVVRGLLTSFMNDLVTKGKKPQDFLTDEECLALIRRAVKQRKDAIEQFVKGGREDLATSEKSELAILEAYLPQMLNEEEIEKFVKEKIEMSGGVDKGKSGQFVGLIMKDLKDKADGAIVKSVVDRLLTT